MWSDPEQDEAAIAWGRSAWEEMTKYGNGRVFLNFTGRQDEPLQAGTDTAFGRNLRRLGRIKADLDPDNFFQMNNNIIPTPADDAAPPRPAPPCAGRGAARPGAARGGSDARPVERLPLQRGEASGVVERMRTDEPRSRGLDRSWSRACDGVATDIGRTP
ncbi:BBE domain-containing protein [Pseudonocardia benzenivorans]